MDQMHFRARVGLFLEKFESKTEARFSALEKRMQKHKAFGKLPIDRNTLLFLMVLGGAASGHFSESLQIAKLF